MAQALDVLTGPYLNVSNIANYVPGYMENYTIYYAPINDLIFNIKINVTLVRGGRCWRQRWLPDGRAASLHPAAYAGMRYCFPASLARPQLSPSAAWVTEWWVDYGSRLVMVPPGGVSSDSPSSETLLLVRPCKPAPAHGAAGQARGLTTSRARPPLLPPLPQSTSVTTR